MLRFTSLTGKLVEFWNDEGKLYYSVAKSKRRGPLWSLDNTNRNQIAIPALNRLITLPDDLEERERIRVELAALAHAVGAKHNFKLGTSAGTDGFIAAGKSGAESTAGCESDVASEPSPAATLPPTGPSVPSIPTGVVPATRPRQASASRRSASTQSFAANVRPPSPGVPTASEKTPLCGFAQKKDAAAAARKPTKKSEPANPKTEPQPATTNFIGGQSPGGVACPGCHGTSYCELWCNSNWYPPALGGPQSPPSHPQSVKHTPRTAASLEDVLSRGEAASIAVVPGFRFDEAASMARAAHRCFQLTAGETRATQISDIPSVLHLTPPAALPEELKEVPSEDGTKLPGWTFDVEVAKDNSRRISIGVAAPSGESVELRSDGRVFAAGNQLASSRPALQGARVCVVVRAGFPSLPIPEDGGISAADAATYLPQKKDLTATVQFYVGNFPVTKPLSCAAVLKSWQGMSAEEAVFALTPQVRLDMAGDEVRLVGRESMPGEVYRCEEAVRIARGEVWEHRAVCAELVKDLKEAGEEAAARLEEITGLRQDIDRLGAAVTGKEEENYALRVKASASEAETSRLEIELEETKRHGEQLLGMTNDLHAQLEAAHRGTQEELRNMTELSERRKAKIGRLGVKIDEYEAQRMLYQDIDNRQVSIVGEIQNLKDTIVRHTQKNRELKAEHQEEIAKLKAVQADRDTLLHEATARHTSQLAMMEARAVQLSSHMEVMAGQVQNSAAAMEEVRAEANARVGELEAVIADQRRRLEEYEAVETVLVQSGGRGPVAVSPQSLHAALQGVSARSQLHAKEMAALRRENDELRIEMERLGRAPQQPRTETSGTSPLRGADVHSPASGDAGSLKSFLQSMHVRPRVSVRNAHIQTIPQHTGARAGGGDAAVRVVFARTRAAQLAKYFRKLSGYAWLRRGGAHDLRRATPKERSLAALEKVMKEIQHRPQLNLG
eukprot:TRINITY_DN18266_c0_g1_i1.p1 TRINITY_DN18266_c0_g1~~TRINITY_DN18266_c0_g1_i1.p1  ORF type:complete len:980 (+),score=328.70 TRINITY_DN18266_c0_g1_i1:70-2940(+)